MLQLDETELADLIAEAVKAASRPLMARVHALERGADGSRLAAVNERIAVIESKSADLPRGAQGECGVGIDRLECVGDRLLAHLTNGRAVDAGALPVKEGPAGKDADQRVIARLEADIDAIRKELELQRLERRHPTPEDVAAIAEPIVAAAVANLPPAQPGKDADPDVVAELVLSRIVLPKDGENADPAVVKALVESTVSEAVSRLPVPKDGNDGWSVSVDDVAPLVAAEVSKAIAAIPPPEPGEPGRPGEPGPPVDLAVLESMVESYVVKAVAQIPPAKPGEPGRSLEIADIDGLVTERVQKAVSELPKPRDGESVTVSDVAPLVAVEVEKAIEKAVAAIPKPQDGKDGVGVLGALIDRDGRLVVTLSDGAVKELGVVIGKDIDMADVAKTISAEVAKWPKPENGKDGFGFDDLSVLHDGERGFTFQFTRGAEVKSFPFTVPCVIYRGVFSEGKTYEAGDAVTFGGNIFIARASTSLKPDFTPAAVKMWTLSVKAGRDLRPK